MVAPKGARTRPSRPTAGRILATIACRSAIKLGDKLAHQAAHQEMESSIKDWLTSRYSTTCPHGRSICYRLDHKDIARKLDRHWGSICQRLALP